MYQRSYPKSQPTNQIHLAKLDTMRASGFFSTFYLSTLRLACGRQPSSVRFASTFPLGEGFLTWFYAKSFSHQLISQEIHPVTEMFCHFVTNFSMDSLKTPFSHLYLFLPKHVDRDRKKLRHPMDDGVLAAGEGFEPSQTESESVVLPLHNPAKFCFLRPATHERRTYYSKEAEIVKGFSKIF